MKFLVKLEELFQFLACLAGLYWLDVSWWYYLLLLLGPDISMIGYAGGNRVGAICYNIFHHKAPGLILFFAGLYNESITIQAFGLIFYGHSSMDRMFGYGLKYFSSFGHTHLGKIGNKSSYEFNVEKK